jgi:hypothetical protein
MQVEKNLSEALLLAKVEIPAQILVKKYLNEAQNTHPVRKTPTYTC